MRVRAWWPLVTGGWAAMAALLLAAFAVPEGWSDARPLGVPMLGWALALAVLAAALAVQLAISARTSFVRERRLVASSARLRETSAEFEQQAATDMLTGLANRRAFYDRLDAEFRRSRRYGRPLSVLMIDLDHFQQVNDRHGHVVGDLVLAAVARLVREHVRESDMAARYGGEELVVMLPETDGVHAAAMAERLRSVIRDHDFEVGDDGSPLTISAGVAAFPDCEPRDGADLVRLADEALYRAKAAGRDRVEVAASNAGARPRREARRG